MADRPGVDRVSASAAGHNSAALDLEDCTAMVDRTGSVEAYVYSRAYFAIRLML